MEKFPHPANAALLRHFKNRATPATPRNKSNYDIDEYELHTHPDLVEHLWDLNRHCKAAAYGYPVLASDKGVVFGVAAGTSFLALRLEGRDRAAAIEQGGKAFREAGRNWVSFEAWRFDGPRLKEWVRAALAGAVSTGKR